MNGVKTCLVLFILLAVFDLGQCARSGGSKGRTRSRPRPPNTPRTTTRRPYSTARTTYQPYSSTSRPPLRYSTSTYRPSTPRGSATTPRYAGIPPRPQAPSKSNTYSTDAQGPNKITVVNKYNYHYPGYYSLPVQQPAYPGYYYSPSYYHYSSHDTGSTALGFFLGYSLAKLTTPTYSHYSFYDGYRPRYDHYTVHHYYHNRDSVPQNQEIKSNTIVGCVGDTATVCPANTTSLCTSNGALMCVVSATSTVPCSDNRQVNCVTSTIACVNNTAPECKNSNQNSTTISIPCVSNAQVYGEVKYVNNTIVVANATNATTSGKSTTSTTTQYPITTTPAPVPTTSASVRKKREAPQNFCVTVLALPAEKAETEGEKFLKDAKFVVEKFIEKTWAL